LFLFFSLIAAACGGGAGQREVRAPALARAHVGAKTLVMRKELGQYAEVSGQSVFGEKVDILRRSRMSAQIRNAAGQVGWVDGRMLIREQEMELLEQLKRDHQNTPSMGSARAYDVLNLHTSPSRGAPTLDQLKDTDPVEVLGHRVALRAPYQPTALPAPPKKKKKGAKDGDDLDAPPAPRPPPPPANWLTLSKQEAVAEAPEEKKARRGGVRNSLLLKAEQNRKKPSVTFEDWSLVRTKAGVVGWVRTTALVMALPEDVLQYAQRQRITSYFHLGDVHDAEKGKKGIWFWTSISRSGQAFQFDAMRLFVFNTKRHRYETAFQMKDQVGYFPIEVTGVAEGQPRIAVILEDGSGQTWRRRFRYENGRLLQVDQVQVQKPRQPQALEDLPATSIPEPPEDEEQTWWGQIFKNLFGK